MWSINSLCQKVNLFAQRQSRSPLTGFFISAIAFSFFLSLCRYNSALFTNQSLLSFTSCNNVSYMKSDNKLSSILHVILHLAEHNQAMTSDTLALYLKTNPVVIRRMMAGLRQAGLVKSVKGHGGGWTMAKPLTAISLHDVYQALGAPRLFAQGYRQDAPQCLIEQAVNASLDSAFATAEQQLLQRFSSLSLADIAADFALRRKHHLAKSHKSKNNEF